MITTNPTSKRRAAWLLSGALLGGLASSATAQANQGNPSPVPPFVQDGGNRIVEWPTGGSGGSGAFGTPSAGDLDSDGSLELIVERSGAAYLAYSPYTMNAILQVPNTTGTVTAVTFLPRAGQGSDAILLSDDRGLVVHQLDSATGLIDLGQVIDAGAAFVGASQLRITDLGGGADILVLSADGMTVSGILSNTGSYSSSFNFSVGSAASDIEAVDLTGNGIKEIALLRSTGAYIYTQAGVQTARIRNISPGGDMTVISSSDLPGEQLVFVTPTSTAGRWMLIVKSSVGLEAPVDLTFDVGTGGNVDLDFVGIASGDYGNVAGSLIGSDDLVVMHRNSRNVVLLPNQSLSNLLAPKASHFNNAPGFYSLAAFGDSPDMPASNDDGVPVLADMNEDGVLDLAHVLGINPNVQDQERVEIVSQLNPFVSYLMSGYELLQTETRYHALDASGSPASTGPTGNIQISMNIPNEVLNKFRKVRIVGWLQDQEGGYLTSTAHGDYIYDLEDTKIGNSYQNEQYANFDIPYADTVWPVNSGTGTPGHHQVFFQIRFFDPIITGPGSKAPLIYGGFTLRTGSQIEFLDYNQLLDAPNVGAAVIFDEGNHVNPNESVNNGVGAWVPGAPIPITIPNTVPNRPPPENKGRLLITPVY